MPWGREDAERRRTAPAELGTRATIEVDGVPVDVPSGIALSTALRRTGRAASRRNPVTDEPRGAFCGMGVCFECLVEVDGLPGTRACLVEVRHGMQVRRAERRAWG